jgi:chromosome segregation ATPase
MDQKNKKSAGFVDGLKTEWALFWETILGDVEGEEATDTESKDPFLNGKLETLSLEQIKAITRALSSDRKKVNQRLESLTKELELNTAKLESLKLVGGEFEEPMRRINELSDQGQALSEQLTKINQRLKQARECEDILKKAQRDLN